MFHQGVAHLGHVHLIPHRIADLRVNPHLNGNVPQILEHPLEVLRAHPQLLHGAQAVQHAALLHQGGHLAAGDRAGEFQGRHSVQLLLLLEGPLVGAGQIGVHLRRGVILLQELGAGGLPEPLSAHVGVGGVGLPLLLGVDGGGKGAQLPHVHGGLRLQLQGIGKAHHIHCRGGLHGLSLVPRLDLHVYLGGDRGGQALQRLLAVLQGLVQDLLRGGL